MKKQRWKLTKRKRYFKNIVLSEQIEVKVNDFLGVYKVIGKVSHINETRTMIIIRNKNGEEFDVLENEIIYLKKLLHNTTR